MRFTRLVDSVLVEDQKVPPDKVFVFHGTTTGKAEKFASEGIRVPHGTVIGYMMRAAEDILKTLGYDVPVPPWMKMEFESYVTSVRTTMSYIQDDKDQCIYTSLIYDTAAEYAYSLSKGDGEAYDNVVSTVKRWIARTHTELGDQPVHIPSLYPTGKPLVVGAKVRVADTSIDLSEWAEVYSAYRQAKLADPTMANTFDPFQVYYKLNSQRNNYEIRVYKDIPPGDIFWGVSREAGGNMDDILRIAGE